MAGVPAAALSLFQLAQRAARGVDEGRTQDEILGRIADEDQLREDHEVGALGSGVVPRRPDQAEIAGHIADRGIHLG